MKLSIIISIYMSVEATRRQILHFQKMNLSDDVEFIFVDDGSEPPLIMANLPQLKKLTIYETGSKLAWTQGLGRNLGASKAKGEYLFMTDIDHIISKGAIEDALNFAGNRMMFRRQIGVLDENGDIRQDKKTLKDWGYENDKLDASVHSNTFVMKKSIFDGLGGYDEKACTWGYHPATRRGDDCFFNSKWNRAYRGYVCPYGRDIYVFPLGRFNKWGDLNLFNLFHNLHHRQEVGYKE